MGSRRSMADGWRQDFYPVQTPKIRVAPSDSGSVTGQNCSATPRTRHNKKSEYKMSDINHETPTKDQPSLTPFRDLILALDEALKTRTKQMHEMKIRFQTNIVYSDHCWKS
jgi:hypothetical protein